MAYLGIQQQIRSNNRKSILLLLLFPILLIGLSIFLLQSVELAFGMLCLIALWFAIAYFSHSRLIRMATSSRPLSRTENMRVYNLVENLCIAQGMPMPKINTIDDDSLNAFASGINEETYTVTLSKGIMEKLNDEELEGVIAHELTHIINRDVRLLIVSIIFVGIFAFIAEMTFRNMRFFGNRDDKKNNFIVMLAAVAVAAVAYFIAQLVQLAISRKREYMADAGAAEMTKKPYALASALRKVSSDPFIEAVERRDVAQLFMHNPKLDQKDFFGSLFATHPPIEKRIAILEQYL